MACMHAVTSVVSNFLQPWTVARQAPLSVGFSRQEYWSGLPFPPPEDLPYPGIDSLPSVLCLLLWQVGSLPALSGKPWDQTGAPCVGSAVLASGPPGRSQYSRFE